MRTSFGCDPKQTSTRMTPTVPTWVRIRARPSLRRATKAGSVGRPVSSSRQSSASICSLAGSGGGSGVGHTAGRDWAGATGWSMAVVGGPG